MSESGNCYQASYFLAEFYFRERLPKSSVSLVHGIAILARPPHCAFGHAWIEIDVRKAPTICIDHLRPRSPILKSQFYSIGKIDPRNVRRYTIDEARRLLAERRMYGPWDESISAAEHAGELEARAGL